MLSLQGNTAPYMLYAYARLCGILRKIESDGGGDTGGDSVTPSETFTTGQEEALARKLLLLSTTLQQAEDTLSPHILTGYLYDLSKTFNQFYENCPVRGESDPQVKQARIELIDTTKKTIEIVMGILGIELLQKM